MRQEHFAYRDFEPDADVCTECQYLRVECECHAETVQTPVPEAQMSLWESPLVDVHCPSRHPVHGDMCHRLRCIEHTQHRNIVTGRSW